MLFAAALLAAAQVFVPPVLKGVGGSTTLHKRGPIPIPDARQEWVEAKSQHFDVLSSAGERRTREAIATLETLAAALGQVNPRLAAAPGDTRVILFARAKESRPWFDLLLDRDSSAAPGVFIHSDAGRATILIDTSRGWSNRTLVHELVHNLLAGSGTHLPLWMEEGIAEYFSNADVGRGTVRLGMPIPEHQYALRSRSLIPFRNVLAVAPGSDVAAQPLFYAESWAIVDWMMRTDRNAFYRVLDAVDHGTPAADAISREFGARAERSLTNASTRPGDVMTIRATPAAVRIRAGGVPTVDVLLRLADLLGTLETSRDDARRFLNAAAALDPRDPRPVTALAVLASRDRKPDEAAGLFERALALVPSDPATSLQYGEALLGDALGTFAGTAEIDSASAPRFRKARALATIALQGGADAARANAVVGTSYLAEEDPSPGVTPLENAYAAAPTRTDVALNLYTAYLRTGNSAAADRLFAEAFGTTSSAQLSFAARATFVREQTNRANRLLADGRYDEGAAVVEELARVTGDSTARDDLQRQLATIRATAEANRQIAAYNEAVTASNAGRTGEAIAMIDRLLARATDQSVIRDATALRNTLRQRMKGMRQKAGAI